MAEVDKTLETRGNQYGSFIDNSYISQEIKEIMHGTDNYEYLNHDQKEALDMIATKIGRILSGNPNYLDNWHDIAGYAVLIEKRIQDEL